MKATLADRLRASLRLMILELVGAVERRGLDSSTLGLALRDLGHETERTILVGELRWLERQGLLQTDELPNGALLVQLTERGDLARRGVTEEPGVARPPLP